MTDAELSTLEAKAKSATPGPWIQEKEDREYIFYDNWFVCGCNTVSCMDVPFDGKKNAAYIAAANPAAILDLIAELRQARAERDDLEELLNDYIGGKAELDALKLKDAEAEREWLAKYIVGHGGCPSRDVWEKCTAGEGETDKCIDCWLEAAKEATCQKK